jgi:trehalose/maltose transport system substrate-binding protein
MFLMVDHHMSSYSGFNEGIARKIALSTLYRAQSLDVCGLSIHDGNMRLPAIRFAILCLLLVFLFVGCTKGKVEQRNGTNTIIFKHEKLFADPEPLEKLLRQFEEENPGIKVKDETLPASSDETHQFYAINLEGKSSDFDVLALDVIWVPEFACAGWLKDISHLLPPEERSQFFAGPIAAVTYHDRVYAIPWYIDAGLLYYRKDLLEQYGFSPPETWEQLVHIASTILPQEHGLYGFLWQGKQYEGLICNVLEYIWSNGGAVLNGNHVLLNRLENREALTFLRDLIYRYKISPEFVTTAVEDTTRRTFGNGKAIFMRNWPYAWNLFEQDGSPLKGKVGISALPSFSGHSSASTLGGWQLAVNKFSKHPAEADKLILFLTSYEVQKELSIRVGYKPTRKALYQDAELMRHQPFIARLYPIFENAKPRPVTPYYMMISQVLQPEFSAILSRIKEPKEALESAQTQVEFILAAEKVMRKSKRLASLPHFGLPNTVP